jgi:hypothetical protein
LAWRVAARAFAALLAAWLATTAHAVETASDEPTTRIEALDPAQAEQERLRKMLEGKPKAYVDKVMDPSTLPTMTDVDAAAAVDQTGFRRFASETRFGTGSSDTGLGLRRASEFGQRVEYHRETLNYGEFVGQMDFRRSNGARELGIGPLGFATERSSERITVRDIGFPVTARVLADTTVGDMSTEVTDGLSRAYRLSLGTSTVRGIATRVFDNDFDLRAGAGTRGNLAGGPFPGFERTQGTVAWAGYTRRLRDGAYVGLQVDRATAIPGSTLFTNPFSAADDVTSMAASVGYGGERSGERTSRVRLIYVGSRGSSAGGAPNAAQGLFVEGGARLGAYRHEMGAYSAGPNLRFGDYTLASDNRGAYWRVDTGGLRLVWGGGIDVEEDNPGRERGRLSSQRTSLSGNAQYRLNRSDSLGMNAQVNLTRYARGASLAAVGDGTRSLNASGYYQTRFADWGRTRFRLTVHRNEVLVANDLPASGEEAEWEQDWIRGRFETMRPEFVTTLGLARDRSNGIAETRPTAGVNFRAWTGGDWSISGNLRYTSRTSNLSTSRGLSGTLNTEKRLAGGWRVGASLSLNQAIVNVNATAFGAPQVARSNDKAAYVYLRWEGAGGSTARGVGVRHTGSSGAGSVDGFVFFDGNRDGERQSGEDGVPNVEVLLDGRYRALTDRNGHFEFPLVATGAHRLTLTLETVPLPWGAPAEKSVSVDVPLRGQATARIPVVRVGE